MAYGRGEKSRKVLEFVRNVGMAKTPQKRGGAKRANFDFVKFSKPKIEIAC